MYTKPSNYSFTLAKNNSRLPRKSLGKHLLNIDLFTNSTKTFQGIIKNTFYDKYFQCLLIQDHIHLNISLKVIFGSVKY